MLLESERDSVKSMKIRAVHALMTIDRLALRPMSPIPVAILLLLDEPEHSDSVVLRPATCGERS